MFKKPNYMNISDSEFWESNPRLLYYYFYFPEKKGGDKKDFFEKFNDALNNLELRFKIINNIKERQEKLINELKAINYNVTCFRGKLKSNCIPGMGYISAIETGINLHFLYGFPFISSTTLKGITSDYAIFYENITQDREEYKKIFGTQDKKGEVIFFDALPNQDGDLFTIDVMTPHYTEYYTGNEPPADYLNPTPILFICIKKGVVFNFCIASKDKDILDETVKLLKNALKNIGVGAKTSIGYGLFEIINEK